jgi:hypothetical protein
MRKTLEHYQETPNLSFEPGQAVPADAQLSSLALTARYVSSKHVDTEGLKQHGLAAEPESIRDHLSANYMTHFPDRRARIIGWAPIPDRLSLDQIAHSQRYTAQKSQVIP